MSYRLQLQLSTIFGTVRDVFVVDNSAFDEQIDILRAAEDSMRVKNGGEKQWLLLENFAYESTRCKRDSRLFHADVRPGVGV